MMREEASAAILKISHGSESPAAKGSRLCAASAHPLETGDGTTAWLIYLRPKRAYPTYAGLSRAGAADASTTFKRLVE